MAKKAHSEVNTYTEIKLPETGKQAAYTATDGQNLIFVGFNLNDATLSLTENGALKIAVEDKEITIDNFTEIASAQNAPSILLPDGSQILFSQLYLMTAQADNQIEPAAGPQGGSEEGAGLPESYNLGALRTPAGGDLELSKVGPLGVRTLPRLDEVRGEDTTGPSILGLPEDSVNLFDIFSNDNSSVARSFGNQFNLTITATDPSNVTSLNVTLANGDPLPSWLTYNPATGELSTNRTLDHNDAGSVQILVEATDGRGNVSSEEFTININSVDVPATPEFARGTNGDDSNAGVETTIYYGLDGKDDIHGTNEADYLSGGNGNDVIKGNEGDDFIAGGNGADEIDGGEGNDLILGDSTNQPEFDDNSQIPLEYEAESVVTNNGSNFTQQTAQSLDGLLTLAQNPNVQDSDTIPHVSVNATGDDNYHWYAFTVTAGQTVTLDIDGADAPDAGYFDSVIQLYDAAGQEIAYSDDDANDPGSLTFDDFDSRIIYTFNQDGTYYVRVREFGRTPVDQDDTYTLHVSLTTGLFDDTINGGAGDDVIYGELGNDTIHGNDDNDTIYGGEGNDNLHGDNGNDTLYGDEGDDHIVGGLGDDILYGGEGNDLIRGDLDRKDDQGVIDGDDIIYAGKGDDRVGAKGGNDTVYGGEGNDYLWGDEGDDTVYGDEGEDTIEGGKGNDMLDGGTGNDTIEGNDGDDHIVGGLGDDILYGGEGNDLIRGDLDRKDDQGVIDGDDIIYAGKGDDRVGAKGGNDTVYGGEGNDYLWGDEGDDTVYGDEGDDTIEGGKGNDMLDGGTGNDTIEGNDGDDHIVGGLGDDILYGGEGNDLIRGDLDRKDDQGVIDGDDVIYAGKGDDRVGAKGGDDTVYGGEGNDYLWGDEGNDTIYGDEGEDTIEGGKGNDLLVGGEGVDIIEGNDGFDTIHWEIENSRTDGGLDFDTLFVQDQDINLADVAPKATNIELLDTRNGQNGNIQLTQNDVNNMDSNHIIAGREAFHILKDQGDTLNVSDYNTYHGQGNVDTNGDGNADTTFHYYISNDDLTMLGVQAPLNGHSMP